MTPGYLFQRMRIVRVASLPLLGLTFAAGLLSALALGEWREAALESRIRQEYRDRLTGTAVIQRRGTPKPAWTPLSELVERELRGKVLRLTDLLDGRPIISDRVFVDCDIYGPAVLLPNATSVTMRQNVFFADAPLDSLFFVLPSGRSLSDGMIGVENCVFDRCRFINVGIAGTQQAVDLFRKAFAR